MKTAAAFGRVMVRKNSTRLRRFAVSLIKSKGAWSVPQVMRRLTRNMREVFHLLGMTEKAHAHRVPI